MIAWLSGQLIEKQHPGKLVLDVNGVGYDVETSLNTFFQLQEQKQAIGLHIHTVVREDAFLLYGFLEKQERALFRALIKVNGIGPKLAMAILSSISPSEFIQCIRQKDAVRLTKLPGIGKKTADRLLIEMQDSVKQAEEINLSLPSSVSANNKQVPHSGEALAALEALGYKPQEALKAVHQIDDGHKSVEQLIRDALQRLSGR